jgi:hypothetical protein
MIKDYSTSKMSSSYHYKSKNKDIANLLNVKPIAKVTTKKLNPEFSGSYGDSPI